MPTLIVGPNSTYTTIADAMAAAAANDTIELEVGYSNETAGVTHNGMTISGDATSTGIVLQLGTGVATITLAGTAPINVFDALDGNGIVGNDGNNVITVTGGADAVSGGLGIDRLVVDYRLTTGAITGDSTSNFTDAGGLGSVTINGGFEHFTILTGSGADTITTGAGDDIIITGEGASTVTAGQGANVITGGSGTDTVTALDGGNFIDGGDGANTLTSGDGNDTITGGLGIDTIVAGGGDDLIAVRGGADTSNSGAGDDRLTVDYSASNTAVIGGVAGGTLLGGYSGRIADLAGNSIDFQTTENFAITTGSGNDNITTGDGIDELDGGAGSDVLNSGGGNDTLIGGAGADSLAGGLDNDIYFVENTGDQVQENSGEGNDSVFSKVNFTIPNNVEILGMNGSGLTGTGSAGNDILSSLNGANTLAGLDGDDIYYVGNTGDQVQESAGGGNDVVFAFADFSMPANVEALAMVGSGLTGTGGAGNDTLSSFNGANTLVGLDGNDTYYVRNGGDQVQESVGGGGDVVFAFTDFTRPANIETLVMNGPGLIGTGTSDEDTFISMGGANTLAGLGGNDLYFVNNTGDQVQESAGGGSNDVVFSRVNYTMPANVEVLAMNGSGLTGTGGSGNDLFTSLNGANTLVGLGGSDTYYINNTGDQVQEAADGGSDAVFARVNYTIPDNVEVMVTEGSGLTGTGSAGDDLLGSLGGANTLIGNGGDDTFLFHAGQTNGVTVNDFAGSGADAGDEIVFIDYGADALFENVDSTHWQVTYNGGASHDVITFSNSATIHANDFVFV
jgi:Ca2+-binding RTX toxin-like protein